MFLVEFHATLYPESALNDEEITDLIEAIVDHLDGLPIEPSVSTSRASDAEVTLTVSVTVDEPDELDALSFGLAAMKDAFKAARMVPRDVRSQVTLQPA